MDRIPMSKLRGLPAEANMQYFTVTDQDIRGFFPSVLVYQTDHQAPAYFTPRFFFELCKAICETFNVRQVRRQLAALYSSFTLAQATGNLGIAAAPYFLAYHVAALPKNPAAPLVDLRRVVEGARSQKSKMEQTSQQAAS